MNITISVTPPISLTAPINMVLHCPVCKYQHIDGASIVRDRHTHEVISRWDNPPHRSHLCLACGHIWRPADVATNGVLALKTSGANDSPRPV